MAFSTRVLLREKMAFTQILNDFRSSLHVQLDKAFEEGSKVLLNEIIDAMILNNKEQQLNIADAIRSLSDRIDRLDNARSSQVRIPEIYHNWVNLGEVVQNVQEVDEDDDEDEDDKNTMETDSLTGEVQEDDADADAVEEEDVEADVVDDDTVPEEDEGEAEEQEEEEEQQEEEEEQQVKEQIQGYLKFAEEQEAEEEGPLQELEVDGETYYYDSEGNVYKADENGEVGEPVGTYDESTGEFGLFESEAEAEAETLEPFTYKGKTYLKDSEDNVYLEDGSETNFHLVGGKMARKV